MEEKTLKPQKKTEAPKVATAFGMAQHPDKLWYVTKFQYGLDGLSDKGETVYVAEEKGVAYHYIVIELEKLHFDLGGVL